MCDYSLQSLASRPAKVGDKLITRNFGSGTRGFADAGLSEGDPGSLTAVCVLPGTELAFAGPIKSGGYAVKVHQHTTAMFRQINKNVVREHHDALELPDGQQILLTNLVEGQEATVLQLPAAPKNETEAKEQQRLEVVA